MVFFAGILAMETTTDKRDAKGAVGSVCKDKVHFPPSVALSPAKTELKGFWGFLRVCRSLESKFSDSS